MNGVAVQTATVPNSPPKASEPVSPMNTLAGLQLNHRKPAQADATPSMTGLIVPAKLQMPCGRAAYISATKIIQPLAKPSKPSVRLTALEEPMMTRMARGMNKKPMLAQP